MLCTFFTFWSVSGLFAYHLSLSLNEVTTNENVCYWLLRFRYLQNHNLTTHWYSLCLLFFYSFCKLCFFNQPLAWQIDFKSMSTSPYGKKKKKLLSVERALSRKRQSLCKVLLCEFVPPCLRSDRADATHRTDTPVGRRVMDTLACRLWIDESVY